MKRYVVSAILLVVSLLVFMYGCGKKTSGKMASSQTEQSKSEKLLDMALKISGKKLTSEERNRALRMLNLNEKDVIQGLGVFLELSDGRYPSKLDTKTALTEVEVLWRARHGGISLDETTDKEKKKQLEGKTSDIFFASAFYDKLIREKKDVAYYGDKIAVENSGKVLMRWKISGNRYRVVFGNLTTKTFTAEELAEFEKLTIE
ncbi:MAG: hypothetical protein ACYTBP_06010 [Planctomycetota bacterium]